MGDGLPIAYFGSFNAQSLSLAVDAFTRSTLIVDGVVERPIAIEQRTHQATFLPIGILDAALAFGELGMRTGLSGACWEEQGAAKALG